MRQSAPGRIYLKFVLMRIRQALAVGLVALAPALTGCLTHIRTVPKTRPAEVVMNATLDQLLSQVETRFNQVQSLTATVEIVARLEIQPEVKTSACSLPCKCASSASSSTSG